MLGLITIPRLFALRLLKFFRENKILLIYCGLFTTLLFTYSFLEKNFRKRKSLWKTENEIRSEHGKEEEMRRTGEDINNNIQSKFKMSSPFWGIPSEKDPKVLLAKDYIQNRATLPNVLHTDYLKDSARMIDSWFTQIDPEPLVMVFAAYRDYRDGLIRMVSQGQRCCRDRILQCRFWFDVRGTNESVIKSGENDTTPAVIRQQNTDMGIIR